MPDAYDQSYIDRRFAELSPDVIRRIRRQFSLAARGAKFGAGQHIEDQLLGKLRSEIEADASAKNEVAAKAQAARDEAAADQQSKIQQTQATEDRRRLQEQQAWNDYITQQNLARFQGEQDRKRESDIVGEEYGKALHERSKSPLGAEIRAEYGVPTTEEKYSELVSDDEERRKRRLAQGGGMPSTFNIPVSTPAVALPSLRSSTSFSSTPSYRGFVDPRTGRPETPPNGNGTTTTNNKNPNNNGDRKSDDTGKDFEQVSGDINRETPNEFKKFFQDTGDTVTQIGRQLGDLLGFAPTYKQQPDEKDRLASKKTYGGFRGGI